MKEHPLILILVLKQTNSSCFQRTFRGSRLDCEGETFICCVVCLTQKKALREQWLMDGLSQPSEEDQEAMRLQAEGEQQQSDELQKNIFR